MTGTTVTKIDIFTVTGLTLVDDTTLEAGAVLKISVEFPITFKGFRFDIEPYTTLENYKNGDPPVEFKNFIARGENYLGDRYMDINIIGLYHLINNFINEQYNYETVSEVITYEEEKED